MAGSGSKRRSETLRPSQGGSLEPTRQTARLAEQLTLTSGIAEERNEWEAFHEACNRGDDPDLEMCWPESKEGFRRLSPKLVEKFWKSTTYRRDSWEIGSCAEEED